MTDGPFLPPPPRRSLVLFAVGVLFLLGGLALTGWGVQTGIDAHRLGRDAKRTTATVVDSREQVTHGQHSETTQYQVRYRFTLPGDGRTYRAEDDIFFLDQDDVWVELPKPAWEDARSSGKIEVEYLAGDASLNQPRAARRGYGSATLFTLLGLVAAAIGVALSLGGLRRVTPPTPPT